MEETQEKMESWRRYYNGERPHSALGNLSPRRLAALAGMVDRATKLALRLVQQMGQGNFNDGQACYLVARGRGAEDPSALSKARNQYLQ